MLYRKTPLLRACAVAGVLSLAMAGSAFAQSTGSMSGHQQPSTGYSNESGMTNAPPPSNSMTRGQSGNRSMNGSSACADTSASNPGTSTHLRPGCRPANWQKQGAGNQGQGGSAPH